MIAISLRPMVYVESFRLCSDILPFPLLKFHQQLLVSRAKKGKSFQIPPWLPSEAEVRAGYTYLLWIMGVLTHRLPNP